MLTFGIEIDGAVLLAENIAAYENETGRTVQPGQPERLLINAFTEQQLRNNIQIVEAMNQTLVEYSRAPALDELGKLMNVTRLPASAASCTLQFTCIASPSGNVIPAGTRVGSADGKVAFAVAENTTVGSGVTVVTAIANANEAGFSGNGYAPGEVLIQLDPLPFVLDVENTTTSAGGANAETDDQLRLRIKLAPSSFSVAGPRNAYKFFALGASPVIIDVAVSQITPGTVGIYPLVAGGVTPIEVLALVTDALSADDIRPLCDTVVVEAPTVIAYNITVGLEVLEGTDVAEIEATVEAALQAYAAEKGALMGRDIVRSQIISRASVPGVYDVTVVAPAADAVVAFNEVAILGTLTVTVTGDNPG